MFTLYIRCLFLLAFVNPLNTAFAENATTSPQIKYLTQGEFSAPASIKNLNWISGHWQGEIWGDQFEEIWSPKKTGSMMASFKFTDNIQVKFYELIIILVHQGNLLLKLKHFGQDLTGWEKKDQNMDFKLVRLTHNAAYFEGYTYKLINLNKMHVYVVIDNDGEKPETKFASKRSYP